jgi:hypothetical protein
MTDWPRRVLAAACLSSCLIALAAPRTSESQAADAVVTQITMLEQSYAASRQPALKFLLAEAYARVGERKRALEALTIVVNSGRGYLPPSYSPLWKYADDADFSALLAQLRARVPVTSLGSVKHVLRGASIVPEGIAYDERTKRLYIGDMHGRQVYAIGKNGELAPVVKDLALQPLGLFVDAGRRRLWIASNNSNTNAVTRRSELVRIDLETGERRAFSEPRAAALNDVTVAPNGDVYTSDFGSGAVFKLTAERQQLTALLEPGALAFPNGIAVDHSGQRLFVAQGLAIVSIELPSGRMQRLAAPEDLDTIGTDGLYYRGGALYGVQNLVTPGRVVRMRLADDGSRISGYDVLESAHVQFDVPTTATFAGDTLLVLANAQIYRLDASGEVDARGLKPIVLLGYDIGPE